MLGKFLKYSISSIISMWIFSLYTMVDGIFIGRYVGPLGIGAVNILMPFINLIFAIGIMTGVGAGTILAINLGKGEREKGNRVITIASYFLLIVGVIISTIIQLNLSKVVLLLGATPELVPYVSDYLSVISLFAICFMIGYSLEVYIKVDGSPIYPTVAVIIGGVVNIILDYLFVAIWGMGIKGAAVATGISQITTTSLLLYYVFNRAKVIGFVKTKFEFKILKEFLKTGFPEFLTEIATGVSTLIFNLIIISKIGDSGLASFGIINYLTIIIVLTMIGLNQGMQPLLSYNFGKGDKLGIKKIISIALFTVVSTSLLFFVLAFFKAEWIISTFVKDTTTIRDSILPLKLYSLGYLILGVNTIISGYFTAISRPKLSNLIIFLRGFLFLGGYLYILPLVFGNMGIWIAMPLAEISTLGVSLILFKKNRV